MCPLTGLSVYPHNSSHNSLAPSSCYTHTPNPLLLLIKTPTMPPQFTHATSHLGALVGVWHFLLLRDLSPCPFLRPPTHYHLLNHLGWIKMDKTLGVCLDKNNMVGNKQNTHEPPPFFFSRSQSDNPFGPRPLFVRPLGFPSPPLLIGPPLPPYTCEYHTSSRCWLFFLSFPWFPPVPFGGKK